MIAANVVHTLDAKTLRAARKPGLYDRQIVKAKTASRPGKDAFGYLYGSRKFRKVFLEAMDSRWDCDRWPDMFTPAAHSFTEHGDFTGCAGRGV